MAFVQLSVCGLEGVVVEEISVVNRDDFSRASGGEMDAGKLEADLKVVLEVNVTVTGILELELKEVKIDVAVPDEGYDKIRKELRIKELTLWQGLAALRVLQTKA